ncbi:MAG: MutS-related protein [Pseudobacter sp.]|uniref:MutS-related protein n=1 Tax=Pseudobacter sp. TaxID=2045420 RepID=UPI003F818ED9
MKLHTDEQTIDDLRIFSKRDVAGIYDIYNHTHTHGGENLLQEMFRNPLSDVQAINNRSSLISRFASLDLVFPFNASLFDMAEKYLAHPGNQPGQGGQGQLSEKDVQNGVRAVTELIQLVKEFIDKPAVKAIEAYSHERNLIAELLADPALEPAMRENLKSKLSYSAVAAYDLLFRTRERNRIEKLLGYLYSLDVYLSIGKVANSRNFIFPVALEKGKARLLLKGVYHPAVQNAITNDITMDSKQGVIFLTGANMAGKSTFLRSLSTAVFLAHMGFPVAAEKMEFSVMDGIYTTINLPDNLGIGASHFYAEVLRVKKVAAELKSGKSLFIVFDELFRGTNVKDAHEATVAVTKAFASRLNSLFIISSHIVEAGEDLERQPNAGFLYLPTRMNGHVPEYTYKLERGITEDRHGMIIIRNEGILDILEKGKKRAV